MTANELTENGEFEENDNAEKNKHINFLDSHIKLLERPCAQNWLSLLQTLCDTQDRVDQEQFSEVLQSVQSYLDLHWPDHIRFFNLRYIDAFDLQADKRSSVLGLFKTQELGEEGLWHFNSRISPVLKLINVDSISIGPNSMFTDSCKFNTYKSLKHLNLDCPTTEQLESYSIELETPLESLSIHSEFSQEPQLNELHFRQLASSKHHKSLKTLDITTVHWLDSIVKLWAQSWWPSLEVLQISLATLISLCHHCHDREKVFPKLSEVKVQVPQNPNLSIADRKALAHWSDGLATATLNLKATNEESLVALLECLQHCRIRLSGSMPATEIAHAKFARTKYLPHHNFQLDPAPIYGDQALSLTELRHLIALGATTWTKAWTEPLNVSNVTSFDELPTAMSYSLHFLSQLHKIRRSKKHIQVALQTNFKLESIIPAYKKLGENIGQLKPRELTLRIDSADLYSHHFFESLAQHLSRQTLDCLTLEFQVQSNPELISRLEKIHNIALRDRFSPLSKLIQCLSPNQLRQLSALEEDQEKVSFVRRFHISSLAQIFKNLSDLTQQRIRTKKLVINGPVEVFVEAINADLFEVIETLCLNSNLNAWPKVHDSTEQCDQQVFSTLKGHFPHITRLEIKADVPLQTIREVIGIEDYPNLEQLILH